MKYFSVSTGWNTILISLLISCAEDNTAIRGNDSILPVKEIHYNFETGDKVGEKTFTYDNKGNLILEYYNDLLSSLNNKEVKYEYDANGNLVKQMLRDPNISDKYFVNVFTFENGLKKSEASLYDGNPQGYRSLYFYSENFIDSAQLFYYSTLENEYVYMSTTLYEYDSLNRVSKIYDKSGSGNTTYRYEMDRLAETCSPIIGAENLEICVKNEYNSDGKLVKVSSLSPTKDELQEELFYTDDVLDSKKIYTYPAYEPGNTVDIRLIKFEY